MDRNYDLYTTSYLKFVETFFAKMINMCLKSIYILFSDAGFYTSILDQVN